MIAGCSGGGTPRSSAPTELIGSWYNGTVSDVNFVDVTSGDWSNGGGTGLFYTFKPDGTFEYGWSENSALYGCTDDVMVYKSGTISVDPTKSEIDVFPALAHMHSEDTCVAANNYEKDLPTDPDQLFWTWSKDDYGNTYLDLRNATSTYSEFRPFQTGS